MTGTDPSLFSSLTGQGQFLTVEDGQIQLSQQGIAA